MLELLKCLEIKRLGAILCCGNKLNFLGAETIQYCSLSPVMCPSWNKTDLFDKKQTQTDPKWPKGLLNRPRYVKTDPIGSSVVTDRAVHWFRNVNI